MQSAYFGEKPFSLFTAYTYYKKDEQLKKLPTTVLTEAKDKGRTTSMSCIITVIDYAMEQTTVLINKELLMSTFPNIKIEWNYNEAQHGKGPMDGIGGTLKNGVFRKVLSQDIVINMPEEFTKQTYELCKGIKCIYLSITNMIEEPAGIDEAPAIYCTYKVHKLERDSTENAINFFYLSSDKEPYHR